MGKPISIERNVSLQEVADRFAAVLKEHERLGRLPVVAEAGKMSAALLDPLATEDGRRAFNQLNAVCGLMRKWFLDAAGVELPRCRSASELASRFGEAICNPAHKDKIAARGGWMRWLFKGTDHGELMKVIRAMAAWCRCWAGYDLLRGRPVHVGPAPGGDMKPV